MQLKKGTTIANRYVISGILGTGGMAIVYKAKDIKLERDVTLKIMREEFISDDDFVNRFNVEAKAAAKLSHQNIVNVYDVGKHGDIYYIVMEYIEGVTLKDIIRTKGVFTNEELLGVSIQIASALEVAHKNNIIHRDIKPQNILVTVKGDVKVTDFGIARAVNSNTVTAGNNTMGSVHYFSPEQARGGYIDQKSDIYSLGITMYEMATGEIPFDDETVVAIALKHISESLPDISKKNPKINQNVINIILKATSKVSSLRFDNMELMNNELKRCLTNAHKDKIDTADLDLTDEHVITYAEDNSATLMLSESDLSEIRTKAMTAFFDNEELDDLNYSLYDQDNETPLDEEELEEEEHKSGKLVILAGAITAILLIAIVGYFALTSLHLGKPTTFQVPDLTGKTISDANSELSANNILVVEASKEYSETVPNGEIIKQDFTAGQIIGKGGTIKVVTSQGSDKVDVADVVGKNADDAAKILNAAGFNTIIDYVYDKTTPISTIVRQSPEAGTKGVNGDTITLFVSKGIENVKITVPSVIGLTESQAISRITNSGLVYGNTTTDYSTKFSVGVVMAQTLAQGSETMKNTAMNITVSKGIKPAATPTPTSSASPTPTPSSSAKASATPSPSASAKGSATPAPTKPVTKQFTIYPLNGIDKASNITIRLVRVDADKAVNVFEKTIKAGDLPLVLPITGTGTVKYQLYFVTNGTAKLQAEQTIHFNN